MCVLHVFMCVMCACCVYICVVCVFYMVPIISKVLRVRYEGKINTEKLES